ncbi:uncharacterized protein LOC141578028 [Camelus bactrianus]|uniref:Uncharacterized protein LOC141578028 n=1 Tax=Camelus bactrianus TaxID=9837 RepID=A0AC58QK73_CAMBA
MRLWVAATIATISFHLIQEHPVAGLRNSTEEFAQLPAPASDNHNVCKHKANLDKPKGVRRREEQRSPGSPQPVAAPARCGRAPPDTHSAAEATSPSSRTSPAPRPAWTLRFSFSFGTASLSTRLQATPSSLPRAPCQTPGVPAATSAGAAASFPPEPSPPPPLRSPGSPTETAACSGRYARRPPLDRLSVPSRKSARSATSPQDSEMRGQGRPARAMVGRGPPSNRYCRRRRLRRRLRPVNFPRGRWEFWETRRCASAFAPPPPQSAARLGLRYDGLRPQLTAWFRCLPEERRPPSLPVSERQSRGHERTKNEAHRTEPWRPSRAPAVEPPLPTDFSLRTGTEPVTPPETDAFAPRAPERTSLLERFGASRRNQPCQHLDCIPVRPVLNS